MSIQGTTPIAPPPPPRPPKELLTSSSFLLKRLGFRSRSASIEAYEATGLNPYHHAVLALLDEEPRETQAMIADALGYDRSHLVGVLDELEAREELIVTPARQSRHPTCRAALSSRSRSAGKDAARERLRVVAKQVEDEFFEPLSRRESARSYFAVAGAHRAPP